MSWNEAPRKRTSDREESTGRNAMYGIRSWWVWLGIVAAVVAFIGLIGAFTFLGYYWTNIGDQEIGVETVAGNVTRVLPPGIHSNGTMWADLHSVNVSQLPWCAVDPEVLTNDNQRLGFVVCGTVQRPGLADLVDTPQGQVPFYLANSGENWVGYKSYYLSDTALAGQHHLEPAPDAKNEQLYIVDKAGLMQQLGQQAMKSCVGDRSFKEAVVGSNRDELRGCIDTSVSALATAYGGLKVQNVVVPNVILGSEVQQKLDEITTAKFETELAIQEAEKAKAEANRQLAIEQGQIRVDEGKLQEQAKQRAMTAEMQAVTARSRQELINAEKANELLTAQLDVEIAEVKLSAAKIQTQAEHAWDIVLAELFSSNEAYARYLLTKVAADAWDELDKVVIPAGTDPFAFINPWGSGSSVLVNPPK